MEQLTALKQRRLSSGRILTFEAAWQDFPIFSHIRSSGTGGSRGQRASRTRKSGQSQRRSNSGISGESDWEERFNLRSSFSTEKVVADLEESEDEKDDWVEQDEVEEVQMEDEENYKEEFDWRSENSPLGACEAKLSEMVAMMQKAGDRIQFGD